MSNVPFDCQCYRPVIWRYRAVALSLPFRMVCLWMRIYATVPFQRRLVCLDAFERREVFVFPFLVAKNERILKGEMCGNDRLVQRQEC